MNQLLKQNALKILLAILTLFVSCGTNVVFLELIIKESPEAGNIITLAHFLFIAIEGYAVTSKFGTVPRIIPMKHYLMLVSLFFVVSLTNNYSLNFGISMPLHMIFKSGSLIANMILGVIILKRRYSLTKYVSIAMITAGIALCTIASATNLNVEQTNRRNAQQFINWLLGLLLLVVSLFSSSYLGIFQETLYLKFGKHPKEALFYTHLLPLPGFLLFIQNIYQQVLIFNSSDVVTFGIPKLWMYLLANAFTQYCCIRSVFYLTTECTSLTVTLIVTLRKFLSLIFSVFYFQNQFTLIHWIGTTLVFFGTLIFIDVSSYVFHKKTK